MNFAALSGLWLGLIAIPVVALYFLKIKRHRRTVPYLRLWADLVDEKRVTTLFRRLQRWLSLLLQLLIVASLVGAFGVLTLSDSFLQEESVVLVLDTSASTHGLASRDGTRTRFQAGLEKARELVEGRSSEDEFAVIAAGPEPVLVQGFTRSTLRLREALDQIAPTSASGDLDAAVRLAGDVLQGKDHPRVLLLCDAAGGAAADVAAKDERVRWVRIGESVPNVAIRRFQVRRNDATGSDEMLLVVANESDEKASVEVEVSVEGTLKNVLPVQLEPRGVENLRRDLSVPQGGFLSARVVHPKTAEGKPGHDGLSLDDTAWAEVPPKRAYRVLLVTRDDAEEAPFLAALDALGDLVDRAGSSSSRPEQWASLSADAIAAHDLVVMVNWAPESLPPKGRFLCLNALPGGLPAKVAGIEKSPRVRSIDETHPMNRFLDARSLMPPAARPLDLTGGRPFLSTFGGPVGVAFRDGDRQVVYLGFDMLSDLFFLQVSFPIVVRNALAWLHEERTELLPPTLAPGEVLRPRLPLPDKSVEIAWKRGEFGKLTEGRTTVQVGKDGRFWFADTLQPGCYAIASTTGLHRTTVNLFDPNEEDLTMPEASGDVDLDIERAGFLFGRDLWPLLLLLAAVLSILEWGLYHRRLTE